MKVHKQINHIILEVPVKTNNVILFILFSLCYIFGFFQLLDFLRQSPWLGISFSLSAFSIEMILFSVLKKRLPLFSSGGGFFVIGGNYRGDRAIPGLYLFLAMCATLCYVVTTGNVLYIIFPVVQIWISGCVLALLYIVVKVVEIEVKKIVSFFSPKHHVA